MGNLVIKPLERLKSGYENYSKIAGILLVGAIIAILYLLDANKQKEKMYTEKAVTLTTLQKAFDSTVSINNIYVNTNHQIVDENIGYKAREGDLKKLSAGYFSLKAKQDKLIKSVILLTKVNSKTIIKTIYIPYDSAYRTRYVGRTDSIAVPQRFAFTDSVKSISGFIQRKGLLIDSISIPNSLVLRFGVKKTGFLGLGRQYFVQAVNSNPLVGTGSLGAQYYKAPQTFWSRILKPAIIGGIFITSRILRK